jgi:hypothetical protein
LVGADVVSTNVAGQDELAQLEAERDRLLSMIAYHDRPMFQTPPWFPWIAVGMICAIGAMILAGVFAGEIGFSGLVFAVVFLGLTAYILTRKAAVSDITFRFRVGDTLPGGLPGQPVGEPEARQRLAECEARILILKERRP